MEPTSKQQQRSPGTRPTLLHSYRGVYDSHMFHHLSVHPDPLIQAFFYFHSSYSSSHVYIYGQTHSSPFHEGLFQHLSHCSLEWSQFPSLKRIFDSRQMEPRKNLSATSESTCAPRTRRLATLTVMLANTEETSEKLTKWIWTHFRPWSYNKMWMFWNTFVPVKAILLSFAVNLQSFFSHQRVLAFDVLKRTRSNVSVVCMKEWWNTFRPSGPRKKSFVGLLGTSEWQHSKINKLALHYVCVVCWTVRVLTKNDIYSIKFRDDGTNHHKTQKGLWRDRLCREDDHVTVWFHVSWGTRCFQTNASKYVF